MILLNLSVFFAEIFIFIIAIRLFIPLKEINKIGKFNLILISVYIILNTFYITGELYQLSNLRYINYINSAVVLLILYRLINLNIEVNYTFEKNGKMFTYFHQKDKRWKNISYNNSTIGDMGCGLAVLAMIHSISNESTNPDEVGKWVISNCDTGTGGGTSTDTVVRYLNNIGFENHYLTRDTNLSSEIKSDTVICVLWKDYPNYLYKLIPLSIFNIAHYVLLYDIHDDMAYIANPINYAETIKPIRLKKLLKKVNRNHKGVTHPYISVII